MTLHTDNAKLMPSTAHFQQLLGSQPRRKPCGVNHDHILPAGHYAFSRPRQYRVYVPDSYSPAVPMPVLLVLHGCQQSHLDIQTVSAFDTIADREGFIVVYPYVTSYLGYRNRNCWGWWKRSHRRRGQGEVEDIRRLVDRVAEDYPIDMQRVHICGLSSGAAMAVASLVAHGDCYASGASVAGVAYGEAASSVGGAPHAFVRHKPLKALMRSMRRHLYTDVPPPLLVVQSSGDTTVSAVAGKALADTWRTVCELGGPDWQAVGSACNVPWQIAGYGQDGLPAPLVTLHVDDQPHGWLGGLGGAFSTPRAPRIAEAIWWHCQQSVSNPATRPEALAAASIGQV